MTAVEHVFTHFVRSLNARGEPTDPQHFAEVWRALAKVLRREIQRRGLWESPPCYLGVLGWERFGVGDAETVGGGALEELLTACYLYVFVERLGSLRAQVLVKEDIEGLIVLSVRHFVHDIQRQHDPLGFRIFAMLRAALRGALHEGQLFVLGGDPQLRNNTLLGNDPHADPADADDSALGAVVSAWNDVLLPDLVTARGHAHKRMVATLESLLVRLPVTGIEVFRFGPLIDEMKRDVRTRWGALLETADGETVRHEGGDLVSLVRQMRPDLELEARDRFHQLASCLAESVERSEGRERARAHLSTLWEFVCAWAAETEAKTLDIGDGFPSLRRLAGLLQIPRDRLPNLFDTLKSMAEDCVAAISSNAAVSHSRTGESVTRRQPAAWSQKIPRTPAESSMSEVPKHWQALLRQTDLARQRQGVLEVAFEGDAARNVGDLFVLEASKEQSVEWAVLAEDTEGSSQIQVVAVDSSTLVGSADLATRVEQRGPVTVRCGTTAWLARKVLQGSRLTGRLKPKAIEQASQKVRQLAAGETVGNAWERQVDADPEYQQWHEDILDPARFALPDPGPKLRLVESDGSLQKVSPAKHRFRPWLQPLALAASLFLMLSLGLGREVFHLRQASVRQAEVYRQEVSELEGARREGAEVHRREVEKLEEEHQKALVALDQQYEAGREPSSQAGTPPMPLVNLPFVVLSSTRLRSENREVRLYREADYLLVIFQVEDPDPEAHYRLQLLPAAGGSEVWSHRGLTLTGRSEFSIALPQELLLAGEYRFLLTAREGDDWRPVDEYGLRVR